MAGNAEFLRGSIDVSKVDADTQPEAWRRAIFNVVPAGMAPFTAFLNATASETTPSRSFNWWIDKDNEQRGTVVDVHTAPLPGGAAYSTGGVEDDTVYIALSTDDAGPIIPGHTLLIIDTSSLEEVAVDVLAVHISDDSGTYVTAALLEDDDEDVLAETDLTYWIAGDAQVELAPLPDALAEEPTKYTNITQIMAESIEASGTKLAEVERITPEFWTRQRKKALLRLRKRMEKAALFGRYKIKTVGGRQQRFMKGLVPMIDEYTSGANIWNFKTWRDYAGESWLNYGMNGLLTVLELLFRYTESGRKYGLIGHAALQKLQELIMDHGHMELKTRQTSFGIQVTSLVTVFGTVELVTDPLFSQHPSRQYSLLLFEPELCQMKIMNERDLKFLPDINKDKGGFDAVDGVKEGWRIEFGLQAWNFDAMGYIKTFGVDNTAS